MRAWLVLLFIAPAAGQVTLLDDAAADHGAPMGFEENDLLSLTAHMADGLLSLTVATGGLTSPAEVMLLDSSIYYLHFSYGEADYQAWIFRRIHAQSMVNGPSLDGGLDLATGNDYRRLALLDASEDTAAGTLTVRVPAKLIVDEDGVPWLPGRALTDWWVEASNEIDSIRSVRDPFTQQRYLEETPWFHDRMPDADNGTEGFVRPIPEGASSLSMRSPVPLRSSNGGPSVFLYDVHLFEGGTEETQVTFRLDQVPPAWKARVVPDRLTIAAQETATIQVVIETQGAHAHGGGDNITVIADSDGVASSLELGVIYPAIAQPAGHHPQLFLHTKLREPGTVDFDPLLEPLFPQRRDMWMNTLADDPLDEGERAPGYDLEPDGWRFDMAPGLAMGLEVLAGESVAHLSFSNVQDVETAGFTIWTELAVLGDERIVVGTSEQQVVTLGSQPLGLQFVMPTAAQTIPFEAGQRLVLDIFYGRPEATGDIGGMMFPMLEPGGRIDLMLGEYHDPLPLGVAAALIDEGALDEEGNVVETAEKAPQEATGFLTPLTLLVALLLARKRL